MTLREAVIKVLPSVESETLLTVPVCGIRAYSLKVASLKVIQFWDITKIQELKKESIVETACRHLVENLTHDQWDILFAPEDYRPLCENLPIPE